MRTSTEAETKQRHLDTQPITVTGVVIRRQHQKTRHVTCPRTLKQWKKYSHTDRGFGIMYHPDASRLHAFAQSLGISRGWHSKQGYLISNSKRKAAIRAGAVARK